MIGKLFTNNKLVLILIGVLIIIILVLLLLRNQTAIFPSNNILNIISASPAENVSKSYLPIFQAEFTFSFPIDPKQIKYSVDPLVPTKVRLKKDTNNIVVISSEKGWKSGITKITFTTDTAAINGAKLIEPYSYSFKAELPPMAPPDSPGL